MLCDYCKMVDLKKHVKRIEKNSKVSIEEKQVSCQACTLLLYTDTTDYQFPIVFNKIKQFVKDNECHYAYILHDKDIYDNNEYDSNYRLIGAKGELKKLHYHIVIDFHKQYELSKLGNEFGINTRFIKVLKPKDIDNMLLYLTHIKYNGLKTLYSIDDVKGNIYDYVKYLNDSYKPNDVISNILYLIDNTKEYIYLDDIVKFILKNNLDYSVFRKDFNIIRNLLQEHNQIFNNNKLDKVIDDELIRLKKKEDILESNINLFGCVYSSIGNTDVMIIKNEKGKN